MLSVIISCVDCYRSCSRSVSCSDDYDSGHGGVLKHLGQIADVMYEWEGAVANSLGLRQTDVAEIKEIHKIQLQA